MRKMRASTVFDFLDMLFRKFWCELKIEPVKNHTIEETGYVVMKFKMTILD